MKKKILLAGLFIILFGGINKVQTQNEDTNNKLSEIEITEGWTLLFDGITTSGWHHYNKGSIIDGWIVENGELIALGKGGDLGGDIVTDSDFKNFDLKLEWKISPQGNSGIFYGVHEDKSFEAIYYTAPEYQLIDDIDFPEDLAEWQKTGADYAMHIPNTNKRLKKVGEWNSTEIVVEDSLVQHYLNGKKILEFKRWTDGWFQRKENCKWKKYQDYGMSNFGKIGLQDHGNKIWFRNIKIRVLNDSRMKL